MNFLYLWILIYMMCHIHWYQCLYNMSERKGTYPCACMFVCIHVYWSLAVMFWLIVNRVELGHFFKLCKIRIWYCHTDQLKGYNLKGHTSCVNKIIRLTTKLPDKASEQTASWIPDIYLWCVVLYTGVHESEIFNL